MSLSLLTHATEAINALLDLLRFLDEETTPSLFVWTENQIGRFNTWATNLGIFGKGSASAQHLLRYSPDIREMTIIWLNSLILDSDKLLEYYEENPNHAKRDSILKVQDSPQPLDRDVVSKHVSSDCNMKVSNSPHITEIERQTRHELDNDDGPLARPDWKLRNQIENTIFKLNNTVSAARKPQINSHHTAADAFVHKINTETLTINGTAVFLEYVKDVMNYLLPHVKFQPHRWLHKPFRERLINTIARRHNRIISLRVGFLRQMPLELPNSGNQASGVSISEASQEREGSAISTQARLSELWSPIMPAPPEAQGGQQRLCPYCSVVCPDSEFEGSNWKLHLAKDLAPYICIFAECSSGDIMFESTEAWQSHLVGHLRQSRSGLSFGSSPIAPLKTSVWLELLFDKCPLCVRPRSTTSTRTTHVSDHLFELALISLHKCDDSDIVEYDEGVRERVLAEVQYSLEKRRDEERLQFNNIKSQARLAHDLYSSRRNFEEEVQSLIREQNNILHDIESFRQLQKQIEILRWRPSRRSVQHESKCCEVRRRMEQLGPLELAQGRIKLLELEDGMKNRRQQQIWVWHQVQKIQDLWKEIEEEWLNRTTHEYTLHRFRDFASRAIVAFRENREELIDMTSSELRFHVECLKWEARNQNPSIDEGAGLLRFAREARYQNASIDEHAGLLRFAEEARYQNASFDERAGLLRFAEEELLVLEQQLQQLNQEYEHHVQPLGTLFQYELNKQENDQPIEASLQRKPKIDHELEELSKLKQILQELETEDQRKIKELTFLTVVLEEIKSRCANMELVPEKSLMKYYYAGVRIEPWPEQTTSYDMDNMVGFADMQLRKRRKDVIFIESCLRELDSQWPLEPLRLKKQVLQNLEVSTELKWLIGRMPRDEFN